LIQNELRLVTLGGLAVEGGADDLATLNRQRRKLAVLVVIALAKRPVSRDTLVGMFWGEQDEARARHSLTEALSHIRRTMGRDALSVRLTEVSLGSPAMLGVDALEFAEAVTAGDHARAVSLYGGPFLDGVLLDDAPTFTDWTERQRARMQGLFLRSAAQECIALARARQWADCGALAERWLEADPTSSDAALYRLNALKAEGDRPALMRTVAEYERLRAMLRRDFEEEPAAEVTALAEDVARKLEALASVSLPPSPAVETAPVTVPALGAAPLITPQAEMAAVQKPAGRRFVAPLPLSRRWLLPMSLALVTVAAAGAFIYRRLRERGDQPEANSGTIALAVLPFTYIGPDSSNAYLAEGLTEELKSALGSVAGVLIVHNGRAAREADPREPAALARTVGATVVVDGSVRSAPDRVRVTVRLMRAANGSQLWTDTYERELRDALDVEREIATDVVRALASRLGASVGSVAARRRVDPVTHDLYLRGRFFHNRSGTKALDRAADYYRQAIQHDSAYAPAWAGLAGVSLTKFNWGYSYGETVTPARAFVERALELDPESSEAHAMNAQILRDDWRWNDAARELERALALNPSDVTARHALSHLYFALQRPASALVEAKRALALDPLNPRIGMHLCVAYFVAREYQPALAMCRRGIELDPTFPDSHSKLSMVLMRMGRLAEARRELELEMGASGRTPTYLVQLALIDAYDGRVARARTLADSLLRTTPPARTPYPLFALVFARLGDRERTLAMLDATVMAHSDDVEDVVTFPELDSLRSDPAYREIVRKLGLADTTGS
jgi:DNA-binding SARP family transcriptional activator/TolB-like protein/Tfp pilus assembly protein PilF